MHTRTIGFGFVMVLGLLAAPLDARAQGAGGAFLSDYSKLAPVADNQYEKVFVAPDAQQRAKKYTAVMIDQPEVFVSAKSKYQGMKPDDMKVISDSLREAVTAQLKGRYTIVDAPGPNVLYLRLAVKELMLEKKKRSILAYTPVGAVVKAVKDSASSVTSKVDLKDMTIEGEALDSVTEAQFGAMTASRASLKGPGNASQPVSWTELTDMFSLVGKRVSCRLDNAALPAAEWAKCGSAVLATAK